MTRKETANSIGTALQTILNRESYGYSVICDVCVHKDGQMRDVGCTYILRIIRHISIELRPITKKNLCLNRVLSEEQLNQTNVSNILELMSYDIINEFKKFGEEQE